MNQSDSAKEPSVSSSVAKLVGAFIETYFQPCEPPLNWGWRFLCAWLGSATLFVSAPAFFGLGPEQWVVGSELLYLVWIVGPALYGCLIASAETPHGPVRLYLSGLLLSAFVVGVLLTVWSPRADPGSPASVLIPIPD